ncbi:hypothetical protein [Intrasporangium sp.]|uniref:hypothetical protein n=1 Tax=Intrasporangium sp. TaxID=1925024 RepID=UPI00322173C6
MTQTATARLPTFLTVRVVGWWLATLVAATAAWVFVFVLPYYVNDFDDLPPGVYLSGGMHDPSEVWPAADQYAVGGLLGFLWISLWVIADVAALSVLPVLAVGSAVVGGGILGWPPEDLTPTARRLVWALVVVGVIAAAMYFSPFGTALRTWWLD